MNSPFYDMQRQLVISYRKLSERVVYLIYSKEENEHKGQL